MAYENEAQLQLQEL
jgi:hypothetical protein